MILTQEIHIAPAEWEMWKQHPTTQAIVAALNMERTAWAETLVRGHTINRAGHEISDTAHVVGVIEGIDIFLAGLEAELQAQWEEAGDRQREAEEKEETADE